MKNERKTQVILVILGILALLLIILLGRVMAQSVKALEVVDVPTQTIKVEPLPAQPKLQVVDGTSRVYEDGSVVWQPATNVQSTYNPQR